MQLYLKTIRDRYFTDSAGYLRHQCRKMCVCFLQMQGNLQGAGHKCRTRRRNFLLSIKGKSQRSGRLHGAVSFLVFQMLYFFALKKINTVFEFKK